MSKKELACQKVLLQIEKGKLSMAKGAAKLGISVRQLRRNRRRHEKDGIQGLAHRSRGKPSGRAIAPQLMEKIKKLLHDRYPDFTATFAAEKICKDLEITISNEKIRQVQIDEGLHRPKQRKKGKYHPRRKRRSKEGELIQSDGSIHDWLEGRGEPMTLITFIDDATSKIKHAGFVTRESTHAYMQLTKEYIQMYGCPRALYVDKHSIFRQNNRDARDRGQLTNYGQSLRDLNIELICANSPQAKGRVERGFNTLQDRLIKEMRLAGISTMEQANQFLPSFLEDYNSRFSVEAEDNSDGHIPIARNLDLTSVFTIRESRKLSKNLSFQFGNVLYQVLAPNEVNRLRHKQVTIKMALDGKMTVFASSGKALKFEPYEEYTNAAQKTLDVKDLNAIWPTYSRKPAKHHPWR